MIPLSDENPTVRPPVITILILAAMVAVWVIVEGAGFGDRMVRAICNLGLVPGELTGLAPIGSAVPIGPGLYCAVDAQLANWASPVVSLFLHGGWGHLLGNALFLWVFGNNVEDVMGRGRFVLFYLLSGLAAAGAQVAAQPGSTIPMVGASGAIGGVMGAYVLLYPRAGITTFVFLGIFARMMVIPATVMLGYWFLLQLLSGTLSGGEGGGVAFWAHVGGFVGGLVLAPLFRNRDLREAHRRLAAGR